MRLRKERKRMVDVGLHGGLGLRVMLEPDVAE